MNRVTAVAMAPNMFALEATVEHMVSGHEIAVRGPLSVRTSALVRSHLAYALEQGSGDLFVDLEHAEVCDATGLGVLIGAHHRASRSGRRVVLTGVSPRLFRLLRVTKLDRVIAWSEEPSGLAALAS